MMPRKQSKQAEPPRLVPRVPVQVQVRIHDGALGGPVNALATDISLHGMFIRTKQPGPLGAFLKFELRLSEDVVLARGAGRVVWIRWGEEYPERPAGMGIRFLQIDQDGRESITRFVNRYLQRARDPLPLGKEQDDGSDDFLVPR